jgi:hypothetical protein
MPDRYCLAHATVRAHGGVQIRRLNKNLMQMTDKHSYLHYIATLAFAWLRHANV